MGGYDPACHAYRNLWELLWLEMQNHVLNMCNSQWRYVKMKCWTTAYSWGLHFVQAIKKKILRSLYQPLLTHSVHLYTPARCQCYGNLVACGIRSVLEHKAKASSCSMHICIEGVLLRTQILYIRRCVQTGRIAVALMLPWMQVKIMHHAHIKQICMLGAGFGTTCSQSRICTPCRVLPHYKFNVVVLPLSLH